MYVCICKAVTDKQIRAAKEAGADSFEAIQAELGVATCCGRCEPMARELIGDGKPQRVVQSYRPAAALSAA